jgi:hypothetical protein
MKTFAPVLLILGAIVLYFGWVLISLMARDAFARSQIQPAAFAEGTIVDRWTTDPDGDTDCFVTRCFVKYSFDAASPDGTSATYSKRQCVNFEMYDRFQRYSTVTVRYDPANPKKSVIEDRPADFTPICGSLMIVGGLAIMGTGLMARRMDKIHAKAQARGQFPS